MNNIQNNNFIIIEQKDELLDIYLYILNKLLLEKKKVKCTSRILSKAFDCSLGKISQFENNIGGKDFDMLFKYCGYFGYNFDIVISKKTFMEKLLN